MDRFDQGWSAPGIGYWYLVFPSGRIYQVGSLETQRASVSGENDHIVAVALVGNYTNQYPTDQAIQTIRKLKEEVLLPLLGIELPVKPHRFYGGTACPGNTYQEWISRI